MRFIRGGIRMTRLGKVARWPRVMRQMLRACSEAKARGWHSEGGPGVAGSLSDAPMYVGRTVWDEWDECDRIKPNQTKSNLRGRRKSGQWLVASAAWRLYGSVKPSQTSIRTMETEANEENEVMSLPPEVKSAQRILAAFASFCAKMPPGGYEVRGFHAFPGRLAAVSQTQSNPVKPNQTCGVDSGQWLVAKMGDGFPSAGRRRKRSGRPRSQSNPVKASQTSLPEVYHK
jgi:hypothetical protein